MASNIFTRDNKIFHPLEYGMYKEKCAKELLSFTTGKDIGISDGFAKFFPIEIIRGIGEVKSTLNKSQFTKTLKKLAKNNVWRKNR